MSARLWVWVAIVGSAAGCLGRGTGGGTEVVDCGGCPGGQGCANDGRCYALCNSEKDCDLCSSCSAGLCRPSGQVDCGCTNAAECDDGYSCNGIEVCRDLGAQRICYPGADFSCAPSGDPCLANTCVELPSGAPSCALRAVDGPGCSCESETDQAFCARLGATCGEQSDNDNCGLFRTATCGPACCVPATDPALCIDASKQCGTFNAIDNCGDSRSVSCGDPCDAQRQTCDSLTNLCVCLYGSRPDEPAVCCLPESDAELCAVEAHVCGSAYATDDCGVERTLDCGSCAEAQGCYGTACLCDSLSYGGDYTTDDLEPDGYLDPETDFHINDAADEAFSAGTPAFRNCFYNVDAATEARCVSIAGRQESLLGTTPNLSSILLMRGSACISDHVWLYDGDYASGVYAGSDINALLLGLGRPVGVTGLMLVEDELTLSPDGLQIIALSNDGLELLMTSRSAQGVLDFGAFDATPFAALRSKFIFEAGMAFSKPALSYDGLSLFFRYTLDGNFYEARRDSLTSPFLLPPDLDSDNWPDPITGAVVNNAWITISGTSPDGLTLYGTVGYSAYVAVRDVIGGPTAALGGPLPMWRARAAFGCAMVVGTRSPGGCSNEEISVAVHDY